MNKKLVDETAEESFQTEASEQVEKLQFEKAPTALTWEPTSLSNDVGRKKKTTVADLSSTVVEEC